jgi:hypothetical protein
MNKQSNLLLKIFLFLLSLKIFLKDRNISNQKIIKKFLNYLILIDGLMVNLSLIIFIIMQW